ncbi:pilus assembly protein PilP [Halovibrio sp. HP20-50]|uniref:pilus assembly protein PilP n=1 Tax=Halovibrio sp. HP20-59 TaxID=3080275 RepID=UPI00294AE02D|nr:pilus assembly protein PilP [Halovibrio sp. HP20-59]MEA2119849.1 pilus assembly protein PilP [Halovibrio sp. HP20-59]
MKQLASPLLLAVTVSVLAGCADADLVQLERTLADIRRSPGGQPPVVSVSLPESQPLTYLHSEERSPFLPPDAVAKSHLSRSGSALAPDQQREQEPLERFQLQALRLVGTLRMGGRQVAMIASPDGNVTSVKEGNYMGTDYGRIVDITGQEVRVTERVFTQQEGWQKRQVSLVINENNE